MGPSCCEIQYDNDDDVIQISSGTNYLFLLLLSELVITSIGHRLKLELNLVVIGQIINYSQLQDSVSHCCPKKKKKRESKFSFKAETDSDSDSKKNENTTEGGTSSDHSCFITRVTESNLSKDMLVNNLLLHLQILCLKKSFHSLCKLFSFFLATSQGLMVLRNVSVISLC